MGTNLQSQKDKLRDELKKVRIQIQTSLQKEDTANNSNYPSASVIHVDKYTHLDTHSPLQGKPERQHQNFYILSKIQTQEKSIPMLYGTVL